MSDMWLLSSDSSFEAGRADVVLICPRRGFDKAASRGSRMSRRNIELILGWLDALRRRDLAALRAPLGDDSVWQGLHRQGESVSVEATSAFTFSLHPHNGPAMLVLKV